MHANYRLLTEVLREEWNVTAALVESDGGDCIGALQYGESEQPEVRRCARSRHAHPNDSSIHA